MLWVILLSNAFNLIDGMDGLAGGIALLALGATALVAMVHGNTESIPVCLALIGALLGFLRWLRGTPIFGADRRHLHHQLLALGFSARQAVILLYLGAIVLALPGIRFAAGSPHWTYVIAAGTLYATGMVYGTCRLGYHELTVASGVLASGLGRACRTIRASIHARDVAQLIEGAESLEHVEAILCDNAAALGLRGVEIRRVTHPAGRRASTGPMPPHGWQVEYLLEQRTPGERRSPERGGGYVLTFWGDCLDQLGACDLNRVMTLTVPAIEGVLARRSGEIASPAAVEGVRGAPRATGAMRRRSVTM